MAFDNLIHQFKLGEFDGNISLVPITEDKVILDGAHRISALAYFNKTAQVAVIKNRKPKAKFDYNYFKNRGLDWATMDTIALEMAHWLPNLYVACLWPKNKDKSKAKACISNHFKVAYEKKIKTDLASFTRLIARVYANQPWVKEPESLNDKSLNCFGFNGEIEFVFFTADSLEDVLTVKDEIRDIYGDGKHSIHITDNATETWQIASFLLDPNILNKWNPISTTDSFFNSIKERWFYFKKVQWINFKVNIYKLLHK